MAACPKHSPSKMTQRKRRTHYKAKMISLVTCPQCFEIKKAFTVCGKCGYYNRKLKVLDVANT